MSLSLTVMSCDSVDWRASMTLSLLVNNKFRSVVIALLATLQISACSTEDFANAVAGNITSDISGGSAISVTDHEPVSTETTAMFSYNADLSDAQPLSGAILDRTTVYMFFDNATQYSSMRFYCCKGIDGDSTGEKHSASVSDSSAPLVYSVNLSQYSTTGTRELYVDAIRADGSGYDSIFVNFSIYITTIQSVSSPGTAPVSNSDADADSNSDTNSDPNSMPTPISNTGSGTNSDSNPDSTPASDETQNPASAPVQVSPATTATVAMYSYNANLSDAQPLSGAVLEQETVYMFFDNASQYSEMEFYCCKGTGGASSGEKHNAAVNTASAPFAYSVDLSQYGTTGTRELYVDATHADGSGYDSISVSFSINITTKPDVTVSDVSLSWVAPFEREDNNPISPSEIAGYKIYYGTTKGNYTKSINVNDGTIDNYTVKNLTGGTYYFVITTRDTDGRESRYSSVVTKTI